MTPAPTQQQPNPLVITWLAQLIGTMVIAVVVYVYVNKAGAPFRDVDPKWLQYVLAGGLLSIIPAILYLQTFKPVLDRYLAAPAPATRLAATSKLAIGGALAELPMAFGAAYLMMGGETRWFLGAVLVSLALRTSYRPFERKAR